MVEVVDVVDVASVVATVDELDEGDEVVELLVLTVVEGVVVEDVVDSDVAAVLVDTVVLVKIDTDDVDVEPGKVPVSLLAFPEQIFHPLPVLLSSETQCIEPFGIIPSGCERPLKSLSLIFK